MDIVTREEAKQRGLTRYFTGEICKHGHIAERRVHNRECCQCAKDYDKKKYYDNKEELLEKNRRWRVENREKLAEYRRERRKTDPLERLRNTVRNQLFRTLSSKRKTTKTSILMGYNVVDLKEHIESLWEPWMNWDNYGLGEGCWVIDHIKPVKAFFDDGITDIKVINSLDNLQPLCWRENMIKGCNYDEEQ